MKTAAVKSVDHPYHCSCEGPSLTRVREHRTHSDTVTPALSHGTGGGRSTGGSVRRTPPVRRPCDDGHLPRSPRRPAKVLEMKDVVEGLVAGIETTPCPEPPRPLAFCRYHNLVGQRAKS